MTNSLRNDYGIVSILPFLTWNVYAFGLYDDYIFDLPNFATGTQPIQVNSVQINAVCGIPPILDEITFNNSTGTFLIQIDESIQPLNLTISGYSPLDRIRLFSHDCSLLCSSPGDHCRSLADG